MSKLPGDIKKHKEAAEQATRTLDQDLVKKKQSAHVVPYSDQAFCQASIEWLIATDQVNNSVLFSLVAILIAYMPHFVAYPSFSTPQIPEYDRSRITHNQRYNDSWS
jgi:hypothetical protein